MSVLRDRMTPLRTVWCAAVLYGVVLFALGADRYVTFHSGGDVGLFTQSIATAFHGFANTTEGGSHFIVHFSPILYLCTPLLLLVHSPLALVAVQAFAGGLVAPPLFLIARRRMPESLARTVALVALIYPPLVGVSFADFHENGFAPAAVLWLVWAVDARRWGWAAAFLALTLAIKEDEAAIVGVAALLACVVFARRGERAAAAAAALGCAVCVAVFLAYFGIVRPLAGAREGWSPLHFYAWSSAVDPRLAAPAWSIGRPAYFLEALAPLAFLPPFDAAFVFALPAFAEDLLSHESMMYTMGQHYAAVWIPWVLFAFARSLAGIGRRYTPARARTLAKVCIGLCLVNLIFASPTHWGHYLRLPSAHDAAVATVLAQLPPDLEVGTDDALFAHLGFDPSASLGPARDPAYVILDRTQTSSYWVGAWLPQLERGVRERTYRLVWERDGVRLYQRLGRPS